MPKLCYIYQKPSFLELKEEIERQRFCVNKAMFDNELMNYERAEFPAISLLSGCFYFENVDSSKTVIFINNILLF